MNLEHLKKTCGKCGVDMGVKGGDKTVIYQVRPLTDEDIRPLAYEIYLTGRNQRPEDDWFDARSLIEGTLRKIHLIERLDRELLSE